MQGMAYQLKKRRMLSQQELMYIITHWQEVPEHRKIVVELSLIASMIFKHFSSHLGYWLRR